MRVIGDQVYSRNAHIDILGHKKTTKCMNKKLEKS